MIALDLLTFNGQLIFSNTGDIQISQNANNELAQCLFVTNKGEFKKTPLAGINIRSYINTKVDNISTQKLTNDISTELKRDGFSIKELIVEYDRKINDYKILSNNDRVR